MSSGTIVPTIITSSGTSPHKTEESPAEPQSAKKGAYKERRIVKQLWIGLRATLTLALIAVLARLSVLLLVKVY